MFFFYKDIINWKIVKIDGILGISQGLAYSAFKVNVCPLMFICQNVLRLKKT